MKKKLIIRKKGKKLVLKKKQVDKKIKKKLTKKSVNSLKNLNEQYLDYDLDIDEEFKKTLISNSNKKVDMSLIDKLPKLNSDKIIDNTVNNSKKIKIKLKIPKPRADSIDIDIESLDKQIIGNKIYYIDYDKGIIYDESLNSAGNIGEFGEINI